MSSAFAPLNDALSAAIDGAFAETWTLLPYSAATPNGRAAPDVTRIATAFAGIAGGSPSRAGSGLRIAHGAPKSDRAGHASARMNVSLRFAQIGYRPRVEDRVRRESTQDIFEIAEIRPDGQDRMVLDLNLIVAA